MKRKKIMAWLLAAAMLVTMCPQTVSAQDSDAAATGTSVTGADETPSDAQETEDDSNEGLSLMSTDDEEIEITPSIQVGSGEKQEGIMGTRATVGDSVTLFVKVEPTSSTYTYTNPRRRRWRRSANPA